MPKLFLGFLCILFTLLFLVFYYNPPITPCEIQMKQVHKKLKNGFYTHDKRGKYNKGVLAAFDTCLKTNSPGGCHDMFSRLDFFEEQVKTIPSECGQDSSTGAIRKALQKALRLFAMIAWGETPPMNRYNKTGWLESG